MDAQAGILKYSSVTISGVKDIQVKFALVKLAYGTVSAMWVKERGICMVHNNCCNYPVYSVIRQWFFLSKTISEI